MNAKEISQKDGFGKGYVLKTDGNYVPMESRDGIKDTRSSSAREETGQQTSKEIAIALNTLARHQMKRRLLADIAADMTVCKLEGFDIREYANDLKAEIDNIVRQTEGGSV